MVGQPRSHKPPVRRAVKCASQHVFQPPQDRHVGECGPRDLDRLPQSGLLEELSGDGYQHLEEGEEAHETKEVDEGQVMA